MKNILKIVFLGIVGFGLLVYLTAPKNPNVVKKEKNDMQLTYESLPWHYEIVGNKFYTKKEELFKTNDSYIIVLNHEGLAIANKLNSLEAKNIVLVANVSNTPWLIKKLAVNGKLEELAKGSKIPLINDESGNIVNALRLNDKTQTKYFIYKINNKKIINKVGEGNLKEGSLEHGLNQEELEKIVADLSSKLQ